MPRSANQRSWGMMSGASGLRSNQRRTVRSVACTDTYNGERRYSTMRAVYHGFRFVRVAKLPERNDRREFSLREVTIELRPAGLATHKEGTEWVAQGPMSQR